MINKIKNYFQTLGLKKRFIIITSSVILLIGLLVTVFVNITETRNLSAVLQQKGILITKNLSLNAQEYILIEDIIGLQRLINYIKTVSSDVSYVYILDKRGFSLVHTFEKGVPLSLKDVNPVKAGEGYSSLLLDTNIGYIRDIAVPVSDIATVHLGMSEKEIRAQVKKTSVTLLLLTFILILFAMFLTSFIVAWDLKSLDLLTEGAGEIGRGNLDHRIPVTSTDEIGTLAGEFNKMAEDLKNSQTELIKRNKELDDANEDLAATNEELISTNEELDRTNEELICTNEALDRTNEELFTVNRELEDRVEKRTKEKESLWRQLVQSQKLESIGRLTGGISHDFNNILTTIIGFSCLAIETLRDGHPVKEMVESIYDSGKRAEKLIDQLLTFSRKQVFELKVRNPNTIIEGIIDMLQRTVGENISIDLDLDPKIGNILVDETQMDQVLMNLLVNAKHAMPEGGIASIETREVFLDEGFLRKHHGVEKGKYVMITVKDTGMGMTREVMDNIFEPFFTTKTDGSGSGVGLSTVFGIVKQHDGFITVDSLPGSGTTFNIYLPVVDKEVSPEAFEETFTMGRGNETILVVEDDESIRKLFIEILKPRGYYVLEAESGEEALELAGGFSGDIHVLLTDVVMKGISGWELNEKMKTIRPGIKTIFTSGYVDNPTFLDKIRNSGLPFVKKPLNPGKLVKILQDVLIS